MSYIAINATAIFKSHKTGVEWYSYLLLWHLALEWKKSDPKVVLFVPFELVKEKEKIFFFPSNWEIKPLRGSKLWTQFFLLKYLIENPPILLFSPSYIAPLFLGKIPTINVVHGLESQHVKKKISLFDKIRENLIIKPTLKKSSIIIAVSNHTKEDLIKFYKIPSSKIEIIQSGPGSLNYLQEKKPKKNIFKSKNVIKCIVFGGDGNPRKNLTKAVKIFFRLSRLFNGKAILYLSGAIRNKKLKKLVKKHQKTIVYKKYFSQEEKNQFLKQSHFLFYLSSYEGFGFPVLEAQNYGVIPVVQKNSGLEEVGGEGALWVGIEEKEGEIAQKILNLFNNKKKLKKIQEIGQKNLPRFSWEKCSVKMKKIMLKFT